MVISRRSKKLLKSAAAVSCLCNLNFLVIHPASAFVPSSSIPTFGGDGHLNFATVQPLGRSEVTAPNREFLQSSPHSNYKCRVISWRCFNNHNRQPARAWSRRTSTVDPEIGDDPYAILGLPIGTTDKIEIKRAYRRMAMKYHPDVAKNVDPTFANDRFVKINAAYELLTGKSASKGTSKSSASSSSRTKSSDSNWYTPPHRRSSNYYKPKSSTSQSDSNKNKSEDWRDYIPKGYYKTRDDEDEKYNADGDSFSAIFSDIVTGIAASVASGSSGGGVLTDLIEFLENNFPEVTLEGTLGRDVNDGVGEVLQSNNINLIREELDDTNLMVQQLETKLKNVDDDIARLDAANAAPNSSFAARMQQDEELASLRARKKIVEDYLKRGRKRLLKIQVKLKELRGTSARGQADVWEDTPSPGQTSNPFHASRTNKDASFGRPREYARDSSKTEGSDDPSFDSSMGSSASQHRQSFGSFGRKRGRNNKSRPSVPAPNSDDRTTESGVPSGRTVSRETTSSDQTQTNKSSNTFTGPSSRLPPHRRTASSWKDERKDMERLRQLQIDDEFDKLKKDLGL